MRVCNCVAIEDKMVNAARGLSLRLLPIGAGALQIAFYAFGSAVIDRSGWQGFKHKIDKDFISTYLAELVIWPAFQVWGLNSLLTHCDQQQWHCQVDAFCAALCPVFLLLPLIDKPSMSPEAICVSISTLCQLEMHSVQTFNFVKVPVQHQLLAVNFMTLVDASFLSWARNQENWEGCQPVDECKPEYKYSAFCISNKSIVQNSAKRARTAWGAPTSQLQGA
eukprot:1137770-Pelagomonas_calceolata.AAC.20